MTAKKPCTRCLLEEVGKKDVSEMIKERISEIPAALRCGGEEYSRRLSLCMECEALSGGTCLKCGCYTELRAAKIDSYCPHEKRKW